ncbi:MAG: thiol reductase thioredoxin [Betaproteobacteria bacterium]|nr:MAG: thiol reductase thioredoxin [Betaproteobacteria bacterium]
MRRAGEPRVDRRISARSGETAERGLILVVACPSCTSANRVPEERLGDEPKCGKCGAALLDGKPVHLDQPSFDAFLSRNDLPVVVDFWADWCALCRAMAPAFERAAARYGIRSIPTMIVFRAGQEAGRVSGAMDARSIESWLGRFIG